MSKTNYPGIDYSAGQNVNRNTETGIRFGVISQNRLSSESLEEISQNGEDEDWLNYVAEAKKAIRGALEDFCPSSKLDELAEDAFNAIADSLGDNYQGTGDCTRFNYDAGGYKLHTDSTGDLWVFKSPFFTYAQFCSPCAPGACYLSSPLESPIEANKCYCLGEDWFDDDSPCPYPIYSVETGDLAKGETA